MTPHHDSVGSPDSADGPGRVVVRLDRVSKEYGDTLALDALSLEIRRGEAVAVMGPSGCGKSTLLNMVAGLDRPSAGTIEVHGQDLGGLTETGLALYRRRDVGMIFQFFNLIEDLPALDNVALAAQLTGTSARQARRRALELLDELGVADRRNNYPATLSGGERQRVGVARALMNRPALLLADEPTGALDSRSGEQVMDLLIDLNQIGQTLLIVTHDPHLATRCAGRLVEMADGRIARERTLEGGALDGSSLDGTTSDGATPNGETLNSETPNGKPLERSA
ncbi:ABC transporter ATP-binding protein [Streptomyces sp. NPDC002886]|uniref:ABC transporter ATP-binding protein n=1 Tax=Streptomyces sp. NPDC002886 TaxID=3364667 RepID=UPI0036AFCC0E